MKSFFHNIRDFQQPIPRKTYISENRPRQTTRPRSYEKAVDVIVVQKFASSQIEARVDLWQTPRGRLQHHGLKTEDGLKGTISAKIGQICDFFLQKKGLYMWVDHVPKYYEASSTRNLLNIYIIYIYFIYLIYFYFFAEKGSLYVG